MQDFSSQEAMMMEESDMEELDEIIKDASIHGTEVFPMKGKAV